MGAPSLVRSLKDYDAAIARLRTLPDTGIRLFRGQGHSWPLLLRIPRDGDQRSELMSITIPK
jgi:hypothetical protein